MTAHTIPRIPSMAKVILQLVNSINPATSGKAMAAPILPPEKLIPLTIPRSLMGIHLKIALAIPGKAPASPMPNKKRTIIKDPKFHTAPDNAVKKDHKLTTAVNTLLAPNLSARNPEGV